MIKRLFSKSLFSAALLAISGGAALAQKAPGYVLYSTQNSTSAYLVDTTGANFHTWTFASTARTGYGVYMMPGGKILRTIAHTGNQISGGGVTGEVQIADWNGTTLWTYVKSSNTEVLHHDIHPMPNGHILMICYETKTAAEATAAGAQQNIAIKSEKIIEVDPSTSTIVWEWHAWDHLMQNYSSAKSNYVATLSAHPELLNINANLSNDWMHMNGVDYNPTLDQITFSAHNQNELYVIDHSTTTAQAATHSGGASGKGGDILYRWGNPANYGAGTSANKILNVVHDAHWVPAGYPRAGWLVGFNNGATASASAIDMINPPVNGSTYTLTSTAYSPASYDKRVICNGSTSNMGSSDQLPNGNMLICVALSGSIYEIDSNNTVVWSKNAGGTVAQAHKYTACYISGGQPTAPTITASGAVLTSSAAPSGATYQWYKDGVAISGATAQSYTATANGVYTVKILDTYACSSNPSAGYTYTTGSGGNAVANTALGKDIKVFPNPSNGQLSIEVNLPGSYQVLVMDAFGRSIRNVANARSLDLSDCSSGLYYVSIRGEGFSAVRSVQIQK